MNTIIEIEIRTVFGSELIYPANDAAQSLARIAKTKTLSIDNLKDARLLGFLVKEVRKEFKL